MGANDDRCTDDGEKETRLANTIIQMAINRATIAYLQVDHVCQVFRCSGNVDCLISQVTQVTIRVTIN